MESLGKSIHFLIVDINAPRTALQPGMDFDGAAPDNRPEGKRPTTFLLCEGRTTGPTRTHSDSNLRSTKMTTTQLYNRLIQYASSYLHT